MKKEEEERVIGEDDLGKMNLRKEDRTWDAVFP